MIDIKPSYMEYTDLPLDRMVHIAGASLSSSPEFDTLIGIGLSGGLVVPILGKELGFNWFVVRKDKERTHSSRSGYGRIGESYVFVDDLIDTGASRDYVMKTIARLSRYLAKPTLYVGDYLYDRNKFYPGGYYVERAASFKGLCRSL